MSTNEEFDDVLDGPWPYKPAPCLIFESKFFDLHREEWCWSQLGKFVAIQGDQVAGFYRNFEDAFKGGVEKFGVAQVFLVKEVLRQDRVHCVP